MNLDKNSRRFCNTRKNALPQLIGAVSFQTVLPTWNRLIVLKYGIAIQSTCADAGYDTGKIQWELEKKGITSYIAPSDNRAPKRQEGFRFVKEGNYFVCPNGKRATYRFTEWDIANGKYVPIYRTHAADCEICPLRVGCLTGKEKFKKLKVSPLPGGN